MSPSLFNFALEYILRKVHKNEAALELMVIIYCTKNYKQGKKNAETVSDASNLVDLEVDRETEASAGLIVQV
jgi:predicted transcriptional regulator